MGSEKKDGFFEKLVTNIYVAAGTIDLARQSLFFALCKEEHFPEKECLSLSYVLGKLSRIVVNDTVLRHFGTSALESFYASGIVEKNVSLVVRLKDGSVSNIVITLYPDQNEKNVLFTAKRVVVNRNSITLMLNKHAQTILFSDIIYVDSGNHCVEIHTANETTNYFSTSFSHVSSILLKSPRFLRSYKNCIVNMDKVKSIENEMFLMTNGDSIPIPKRRFRQIKQAFEEYMLLMHNKM